jgi:hypothetical protein
MHAVQSIGKQNSSVHHFGRTVFFCWNCKKGRSGRVNYSHVVLSRREIPTKFCISRNRSGMAKFCTTKTIFCWTFHSTEIKYGMETRIMHQKRERWVKKFGSPG